MQSQVGIKTGRTHSFLLMFLFDILLHLNLNHPRPLSVWCVFVLFCVCFCLCVVFFCVVLCVYLSVCGVFLGCSVCLFVCVWCVCTGFVPISGPPPWSGLDQQLIWVWRHLVEAPPCPPDPPDSPDPLDSSFRTSVGKVQKMRVLEDIAHLFAWMRGVNALPSTSNRIN